MHVQASLRERGPGRRDKEELGGQRRRWERCCGRLTEEAPQDEGCRQPLGAGTGTGADAAQSLPKGCGPARALMLAQ